MDFLNATNNFYGWISTLIRRTGRRKSSTDQEDQNQLNELSTDQNSIKTSDKLLPNLNFIANTTTENNHNSQNAKHSEVEKNTKSTKIKQIIDNDQQKLNDKLVQTLESGQNNIKLPKMDNPTKQESADNSAAEEIEEEAITAGSSSDNNLKELKNLDIKKRKLFDIDDEDENFKIDHDQLSGGKLIQHFKIDDEKSTDKNKSKLHTEPKSEHLHDNSLTNQSTTNDVSELAEEISDDRKENHTQSLELISNYVNYEKRDCQSLEATISFMELNQESDKNNDEKDHSMEEVIESNQSIEMTLKDDENLSELDSKIDINNESEINKILGVTEAEPSRISINSISSSQDDDMEALKQKILSLKQSPKTAGPHLARDISFEQTEDQVIAVKQMEKVPADYSKEILEDITEESEKCSLPINVPAEPQHTSNDFDSIVSLNMMQMLEDKIKVLEDVVQSKDICLASLNMQLDVAQRRELYANGEHPPSGRDSCSLATNSTEYRTLQDDFGNKVFDFYNELSQRDNLIEKLTDSLQQSMQIRESLQQQSDKLTNEVLGLRKQLTETLDAIKKPYWPRDQESNCQRLSEISIDLVSESDEDLDRHFLTDNEDKFSRNSKERQISSYSDCGQSITGENLDIDISGPTTISKQIEQFKKYLNADELRIFFMVQKKFDDYLSEELEKTKMKYDSEIKIFADQMEAEKHDRDIEINRLKQLLTSIKNGSTELMQLRQELDGIHAKEMEDLRLYFEQKCADLEKQFSEEVFSQQSQRNDNNSDVSDHEILPEDQQRDVHSKEGSPRKRTRIELYSSPSHRQMTPTTLSPEIEKKHFSFSDLKAKEEDPDISVGELKEFYKEKIQEIKITHDKVVKKLRDKLKRFETKYGDDEFMSKSKKSEISKDDANDGNKKIGDQIETSSYIIIDEDEIHNDGQEINKIAAEYDRRLKEQVRLAKEDIIRELENHIQALLSETTTDDHNWPPELILLREKFTAKSQLEIAQLQIKHEEEMSRLKIEFEKQLNRKIKRQSTFDLSRDLDQIISEREGLRELSSSFRYILSELVKCVSLSENDLNTTLFDELKRYSCQNQNDLSITEIGGGGDDNHNNSTINNKLLDTTLSKRLRFIPDVTNLLSVIEDPLLLSFISQNSNLSITNTNETFNLKDCIEKLNNEAQQLLELSENLCHLKKINENSNNDEKNDSCEEEDGLKTNTTSQQKQNNILRTQSMNENLLRDKVYTSNLLSLPPNLNNLCTNESIIEDFTISTGQVSELNFQVHELKNRLVKSESDRAKLQNELEETIKRNCELGVELTALRDQLEQLDSQKEDYSEGYTMGDIKSPQRVQNIKKLCTSFSQLQERARNLLSTPTRNSGNIVTGDNTLIQIIEDFCREGDKVVEEGKKDREDLQAQIDAADKQLKATRQFLEDQAAERELERDDFVKEIEKLKYQLRDKEKERHSLQNASKEVEQMEHQIKDLTDQVSQYESKKDKLEIELKASIDKIFVLREIISELETQIETKSLNEHVLNEKVKELENFIGAQSRSSDMLQCEVEQLKNDIGQGYIEKITNLEETLRNTRPSAEQNVLLQQFGEQLRDIATTLDQKTKTLEALHQSVASVSCSTSPCEDVSIQCDGGKNSNSPVTPQSSPMHVRSQTNSLPIEEVQKVFEKLSKHTRVEEAAIKRIKDLEMQIGNIRNSYGELQQERDVLQERMSEQMIRISSLQSKLEEQRRRAEDLQRTGTSDLNIRIHDLQNDLQNLTETLSVRDKQIINLKNHLEQSKSVIDRQETELAMGIQSDRSIVEKLEIELKSKIEENKRLKEKIKSDMINKLALPDLMETMLADKNEEIDHLKEQLERKEKEFQGILEINLNADENNKTSSNDKEIKRKENHVVDDIGGKNSGRTLSDIISISEYDEPDIIRRAAQLETENPLILPDVPYPDQTMESSKLGIANLTPQRTDDLKIFNSLQPLPTFDNPNYFADPSNPSNFSSVNSFGPRQINFSEFINDTKPKESTPKIQEISDSGDNKNIKSKLSNAEDQIEKLTFNLNKLENEKDNEIKNLKTELENQLKEHENLQSAKINLEKEINILKCEIDKLSDIEKKLIKKENDFQKLENDFIASKLNLTQIEDNLNNKIKEIASLEERLTKIIEENAVLSEKLTENTNSLQENQNYAKEIDNLNKIISEKDKILSKQEKDLHNINEIEKNNLEKITEYEKKILDCENIVSSVPILQTELDSARTELEAVRSELCEKAMLNEKYTLDMEAYQKDLENLQETIKQKDNVITSLSTDSKSLQTVITSIQQKLNDTGNLNDLKSKLSAELKRNLDLEKRNSTLEIELEKLRSQNSESSKPFSLDEIAQQVEKELNYSAQLDSNILKAIESEEENNLDIKTDSEKLIERDLQQQLQTLKEQLGNEKLNCQKFQKQLTEEKQQSQDIQQQDAAIIEAMRFRLEEAMAKEQELHQTIDEERDKCERLSTQISVLQRSEARKSSLLLKSPPDSPRKISRSLDFENDLSERLKSEIKLLNAQNEREKERATDLQRVLEREKSRFEIELNERIEYSEKLKREMDKLGREKESAEQEIDHLQERLTLQSQEIESLEGRIATLQEAETRRAQRRDRERNESTHNVIEIQELRKNLSTFELERDHLNKTINLLRGDIDRGAQREAKLAEALANSNADTSIPEQFLAKMKEMNALLLENTKENRQMSETVHILIEERKTLQRKCDDLESHLASSGSGTNLNELEERANHLLGRYLRVESHRKALVHQKRYLLIALQSYEDSENKAMTLLNGLSTPPTVKRNNMFKSAALVVVAIQRMKFIVKRWHTGKRIVSKSVFTITQQKRPSTSNTYNVSATPISLSPPCRDTPLQNNTIRPLQAPALISECITSTTQPQLPTQHQQQKQTQKFDWSRLKN